MRISAACIRCMVDRQEENISRFEDEHKKSAYLKEVLRIIGDSEEDATAPLLTAKVTRAYQEYFGESLDYREIKHSFNQKMLAFEDAIRKEIHANQHPLQCALSFARTGNYIDYGAMRDVETSVLETLVREAGQKKVEEETLKRFTKELETAKSLVYVTDNCGEIMLDKLLIELILELYPQIQVTAVVRGNPVLNDATMEDAVKVGLDRIVPVVGNGTDIAGTSLAHINQESLELIQHADMILAKGQGNFETLHGCGLNIYYLFLCKCDWFVRRFQMEKNGGVFVHESRLGTHGIDPLGQSDV